MPLVHLVSIEKASGTAAPGVYYFRGHMILSNGEREVFEDWLQVTGQSVWMFANEQPLSPDELEGEWFRLDFDDDSFRSNPEI